MAYNIERGSLFSGFGCAVGGVIWAGMQENWGDRLADSSYQNLPREVRQYDKNRDGYLDSGELEQFVKDFELKKR